MENEEYHYLIEIATPEYIEVIDSINSLFTNEEEILKLRNLFELDVELLFAGINEFYFKFYYNKWKNKLDKRKNFSPLLKIIKYDEVSPIFKNIFQQIGSNFDDRSAYLSIESNYILKKDQALLKLYIFALTYSKRNINSSYIKLFYNDIGDINSSLESSFQNSSFICNLPSSRLSRLIFLQLNYDNLETVRVYKCSYDCDFIYFISECGLTEEESMCPYCEKIIGGLNSKAHRSDEQIILSSTQAHTIIAKLIEKYKKEERFGYNAYEHELYSKDYFSILQEIDFHLFNIFIKSNLISIIELNIYTPNLRSSFFKFDKDQFNESKIKSIKENYYKNFLHRSIDQHIRKVKVLLSEKGIFCFHGFFTYFYVKILSFFEENLDLAYDQNPEMSYNLLHELEYNYSNFVNQTIEDWISIENTKLDTDIYLGENRVMRRVSKQSFSPNQRMT